jgi:hypothetical protein
VTYLSCSGTLQKYKSIVIHMEKRVLVSSECEGTGFIAVADSGGDDIEHVECEQHHPAFKADTGSSLGNILAGAKEIERLTSTD